MGTLGGGGGRHWGTMGTLGKEEGMAWENIGAHWVRVMATLLGK